MRSRSSETQFWSGRRDSTRDPHLGNSMADVLCVSAGLSSVPELHVLGDLVSCVSTDRWSRLKFVGDFVGVRRVRICCRSHVEEGPTPNRGRLIALVTAPFPGSDGPAPCHPFLKLLEDRRVAH